MEKKEMIRGEPGAGRLSRALNSLPELLTRNATTDSCRCWRGAFWIKNHGTGIMLATGLTPGIPSPPALSIVGRGIMESFFSGETRTEHCRGTNLKTGGTDEGPPERTEEKDI